LSGRGPRLVVAAAVVLAGLTVSSPAAAAEEPTVTIKGRGFGHGIGMSQYGAYGRAAHGATSTEILQHYYSGTEVPAVAMPPYVRVGVLHNQGSIAVSSLAATVGGGSVTFKVKETRGVIATTTPDDSVRIEPAGKGGFKLFVNEVKVAGDGRGVFGDDAHPLVAKYQRHGSLIRLPQKARDYAYGKMEVVSYPSTACANGRCLSVVVVLPMQKYLYGLGEVSSSWPQAALESQVIAARTYAYSRISRTGQLRHPCFCALYDSAVDQVYMGDAKRTTSGSHWERWKESVDATKGRIVTYAGAPIQAFYSSSSGGYTENNENVWGGTPIPYLRGVKDRADYAGGLNPNFRWKVTMSLEAFESKLHAVYGTGALESFELVEPFGVSGRVTVVKADGSGGVKITGSKRTLRASGGSVQSALGLKDTWFRVFISAP
jgi:SpoIID/LytB domain protein